MTLYSTGCPKCNVLEHKLDQLNIEYRVCNDIDHMIEMGFTTAPMLETDEGVFLNFNDAFSYVSKLGEETQS